MRQPARSFTLWLELLLHYAAFIKPCSMLLGFAGLLCSITLGVHAQTVESALWQTDAQGNVIWDPRLNDFTNVGYMNGNETIPTEADYPNAVDVTDPQFGAIPDDDIDDSQAFIDALAACPANSAVYVPKGRYIMLQRITMDRDYIVLRGEDMFETVLFYPKNSNEIYIEEVGYENPAKFSAGNGYRNTGGDPFIMIPGGTHRSIENLTIEFREQIKMGHWEHKGNDAIRNSSTHSWMMNLCVRNGDHGISTSGGQYITVRNIVFDQFIDRTKIAIESEGSMVGHMAMHLNDTDNNLYHNILLTGDWSHEFDMKGTVGVVISDVKTLSGVVGYHGQGVRNNLYTNLESGKSVGSVGSDNPYNETYWGAYSSNGDFDADRAQFAYDQAGRDHVYVGYDIDASILPTKTDPDFWYEAIEPSQLSPLNLYLAQMAEVGKPVPDSPVLQIPNLYEGNVIRIKGVENNIVSEANPDAVQSLGYTFSPSEDPYIKFNLNPLNLASIHRVRLRLAARGFQNTPVELGVYSVLDDSWTSDMLTYNNRPPRVDLLDSIFIGEDTNALFMEFDVTSFVQDQWANDSEKLVSFNLAKLSGNGFLSQLCSLKNGFAPILIIEQIADPDGERPTAPSGVRATSLIGNIQLDWPDNPASEDVVTYNVYRSYVSGDLTQYDFPIGMGLTTSDFVDVQDKHDQGWDIGMVRPDIPYFYRVTAVDAHGYESESSFEIVASAKPWEDNSLPPSFTLNPVVLPRATQYVPYTASLVGSATDPEGDTLFFTKAGGPDWVQIATDGTITATPRAGDAGTYPITVLVSALRGGFDEATLILNVDAAVPDAPQFVDILPGDASVQLDWSHDAEGTTSFTFTVYRAPNAAGPYSEVVSGLSTSSYADSGLNNGSTYFYVVTAANTSGESPVSEVQSATPIAGFSVGTTYIGEGVISDPASWDNGLPIGQWGRIDKDASFDSSIELVGYSILHTGGTLSFTNLSGLTLNGGSQWITEGDTARTTNNFRGLTVKGGSTFTLFNGTINTSSGKDWLVKDPGSSITMHGGTINLGRNFLLSGSATPVFTIDGGTLTGNPGSGSLGGNSLGDSAKSLNFKGGTATAKSIDLRGDNTTFNFGGDAIGSLTVDSIAGIGLNSSINFLPGSNMSLSVSLSPGWAKTLWDAGELTYNGQGTGTLGSWTSVTSANGLEPGVNFDFDSGTGTLSLAGVPSPNQAPVFSADPLERFDALESTAYTGSIAVDATDPDSDPLTFSRLSGPAWLSVAANGDLFGTPTNDDAGINTFTVQVDDGNGGSATAELQITVDAATPPPTGMVTVGSYTFNGRSLASSDSDSDSVAGDMVVGTGVTTFYWETRSFWAPTQPAAGFNAGTDLSDGVVLDDDFFSFTITPQAGKTLVLNSLSFIDRSGGFSVSVASSQDGFTTVIDNAVVPGGGSTTTLDLSSLSATAGALELRLYFHDGAGSNRMIDNVQIQATYASVTVPDIITETAGNITLDSAEVGFTLVEEGGETPTVFLFHGESDGGITPANWDNSQNLGALTAGSYAVTLDTLNEGTTYYYSVQAFNSGGLDWGTTRSFATDVDTSPKLVRSLVSGVTDAWQTFDLGRGYTSAVIVATPILPDNSHPPVVTRIRNVSGNTFDLKVERLDGVSGSLSVDVSVIAVEEGVYTQAADGVTMEAVRMTSTVTDRKNNWTAESRTYQNNYASPVVLGQVMSANDALWSVFWCQGSGRTSAPDASNLRVGKHVGEDALTTRADETLGYIVIESGTGSINGVAYTAGLGSDSVRGPQNNASGYTYSLAGLNSASAAAVSLAGMDGVDGGFATLYGAAPFTSTSVTLVADEDKLGDSERSHTTEEAGYLVFE